ncbi:EAL domain-containing protein [Campylobacter hyointestinalis]|uniref:EAL domain-containing protein n=1 Tax=Campylobacter hyointestinalis TaxID=198 RepID=UPI0015E1E3E2|nr:GGDEF domain-containing phosphodiesterase [Campylobacter hyointestinalis]
MVRVVKHPVIYAFLIFLIINIVIFTVKFETAYNFDNNRSNKMDSEIMMSMLKSSLKDQNISKSKITELFNHLQVDGWIVKFDENKTISYIFSNKNVKLPLNEIEINKMFFENGFYKEKFLLNNRVDILHFDEISNNLFVGYKFNASVEDNEFVVKDFMSWFFANMIITFIFSFILMLVLIYKFKKDKKKRIEKQNYIESVHNENKKLSRLLNSDHITNLPNRLALENEIKTMENPKIFVIRIDDYINTLSYYGNEIFNKVLIIFSDLLRDFSEQRNMEAYKISDSQFAVCGDSDLFFEDYERIAKDMIDSFKRRSIEVDKDERICVEVRCTIGFCIEKEDTLNKALVALNEASIAHKDFLCYFENINDMYKYKSRVENSSLIQNAILNNKVVPYYQPIFDKDKNIVKYETLVRIKSDKGGIILPGIFLKDSKYIKRYSEIEKILIEKSLIALKENPDVTISINLSIVDMTDGDVSIFLMDMLRKLQISDRLIFEILEDENITDSQRVNSFLDKARKMGVRIAIDDFGSGYSNFSYILKLKPDYLKIDGSIIKNIDKDEDSYAIAGAIVAFAKKLGIKTIAEFVHSKEVFDICVALRVDEFQGFYLSDPKDSFIKNI